MGTGRLVVRALSLAAAVVGLCPGSAWTDDHPADFTGLTMEQLMEVELVHAAARRPQSLREAPSAVTVVSADEIRRQGYRTLGDLLRALPSFYVTYDRNYTYVGVRGFGRPGDYNSRILLLINGVRVNDNGYDSMYVGTESLVDLDLVERVEVVRGPGASLYGNSAFFAVINVITRTGADVAGGEVAASAGAYGTVDGRASYGRKTASGLDFLVSASALHSAGPDLYFSEFDSPAGNAGRAVGLDGDDARRAFGSASWRGFSLHLAHSWREKVVPTASFGTVFGSPDNRTWDIQSQVALQYERKVAKTQIMARTYYGRYAYRGRYAYPGEDAQPSSLYVDSFDGSWWTVEASAVRPAGDRHLLTLGGEGQWNVRQDQNGRTVGSAPDIVVHAKGTRWGFFAQDEFRIQDGLRLHVGLRHDTFGDYGQHTSPRVALVHTGRLGVLKLMYGNAFRAPNQYELFYYAPAPALQPETIRTVELAWERSLGREGRVSLSAFDNDISNLITLTGQESELRFINAGHIRGRGLELASEWRKASGLRSRLSYSFQKTSDAGSGRELTNSPRHLGKLDLDLPLAGGRLWAGVSAQYTSGRDTLAGRSLPGVARANLTVSTPRLVHGLDLAVSLNNVFDTRYADPGSEEHRQDVLAQDGRTFHVKATWKF